MSVVMPPHSELHPHPSPLPEGEGINNSQPGLLTKGEGIGAIGRVSVVIPAYRAAGTICRAVDSVLAQTEPAFEIIVIDDGSPDETAAVVERAYGERVILIRKANGGAACARNAGLERAAGDFIAFLDADDYWEPQKLERQLAVFERHSEVGLVAGRWYEEEPGAERKPAVRPYRRSEFDCVEKAQGSRAFCLGTRIWTGTLLVRREALEGQRFESGLEPAEDRDLWVRLVAKHPVYFMSEALATCVHEPGSLSRTGLDRDCRNMLRVVERNREMLGPMAKRMWRSYVYFRWTADDAQPQAALAKLMWSVMLWPLPYLAIDISTRLVRLKRLAVLMGAVTGLRPRRVAQDKKG